MLYATVGIIKTNPVMQWLNINQQKHTHATDTPTKYSENSIIK